MGETPSGGAPWRDWVGRQEIAVDRLHAGPARALAATLNRHDDIAVDDGARLPPLWLWLYFLAPAPMAQVGPDGHPKRGGFLPPVELPRRMWAGSRCRFHADAHIGDAAERVSTIRSVEEKTGRAGAMAFVTVRHETRAAGKLVMEEEQDIVYVAMPERYAPPPATPAPACAFNEAVAIDPVLLFRFSALTFNGHRIHYDRPYATDVEKYPGLVVHGPLQAILLFDAAERWAPGRRAHSFMFRGMRPLFDFDAVSLRGRAREDGGLDLFTANGEGAIGMQASLTFDDDATVVAGSG